MSLSGYLPAKGVWKTPTPSSTSGPERLCWHDDTSTTGSGGLGASIELQAARSGLIEGDSTGLQYSAGLPRLQP